MLAIEFTLPSFSTRRDGANESLKSYDDLSWLYQVEPMSRADWLRRLVWVRLVVQLAEERLLVADPQSLANHFLVPRHPADFGVSWCEAWQRYVVAVHKYHEPKATLPNLAAHTQSLLELSGNIFCLYPEVDWSLRRSIAHFGALDQYFNNLRDLKTDSQQGRCHFPLDVLARFGLEPEHLANPGCRTTPEYAALMRFWLNEYLPTLVLEAAEFRNMKGLPKALRLLRTSCLRRHARVERVFRQSSFDFVKADVAYWSEVARERRDGTRYSAAAAC